MFLKDFLRREEMSGMINRVSGDLRNGAAGNGLKKPTTPGSPTSSPLQNFVKAKDRVNNIFTDVDVYVSETADFFKILALSQNLADGEVVSEAEKFRESVKSIREMLRRDHMKVVFFGRYLILKVEFF